MGPMKYFMSQTRSGKSVFGNMVQQLTLPRITVLDQTQVDDDKWYTLDVDPVVAKWVRQQCREHWYEYPERTFRATMDVHEHLYTMIRLTF